MRLPRCTLCEAHPVSCTPAGAAVPAVACCAPEALGRCDGAALATSISSLSLVVRGDSSSDTKLSHECPAPRTAWLKVAGTLSSMWRDSTSYTASSVVRHEGATLPDLELPLDSAPSTASAARLPSAAGAAASPGGGLAEDAREVVGAGRSCGGASAACAAVAAEAVVVARWPLESSSSGARGEALRSPDCVSAVVRGLSAAAVVVVRAGGGGGGGARGSAVVGTASAAACEVVKCRRSVRGAAYLVVLARLASPVQAGVAGEACTHLRAPTAPQPPLPFPATWQSSVLPDFKRDAVRAERGPEIAAGARGGLYLVLVGECGQRGCGGAAQRAGPGAGGPRRAAQLALLLGDVLRAGARGHTRPGCLCATPLVEQRTATTRASCAPHAHLGHAQREQLRSQLGSVRARVLQQV